MKTQEFIKYIEREKEKKIEDICKDLEDQTILWINPGINYKFELLLWDSDYKEVHVRNVDRIMKDHPKAEWVCNF